MNNDGIQPEAVDRDNVELGTLGLFIPFLQNHLAQGHTPDEFRKLLPSISTGQFSKLLAEASVAENPFTNVCEDSLGLEPMGGVVGFVDEVNGPGAEECREFLPTRHELSILAKHWTDESLHDDWLRFHGQYSSRWSRIGDFAKRRLNRIEPIIGSEAFMALEAEVMAVFATDIDPRLWKMFVTGQQPDYDEQGLPILPED